MLINFSATEEKLINDFPALNDFIVALVLWTPPPLIFTCY